MEAIKKKMQAMKLEKDNAMDQADACEQATKDAKLRAEKAEEEVSYRQIFFVHVGHETTYASSGNKHFFTKSCHHQTYQNY